MMDFSGLKKLTIDGIELKQLFINGIQVWTGVSYTNQIPISTDASGNIYNGKGWKDNTWLNGGNESTVSGRETTGFIPCKVGDVIRFQNVGFDNTATNRLTFYKSDKTYIANVIGSSTYVLNTSFKGVKDADGFYTQLTISSRTETANCGFVRVSCDRIDASSVITINQEIK